MTDQSTSARTLEVADGLWSIGAVARRTGISEHTLRAWERRFGFPGPIRLDSGHRRYSDQQVRKLLLIKSALGHGYRAGEVVSLATHKLLELARGLDSDSDPEQTSQQWVAGVLGDALALDVEAIATKLESEAARQGVAHFLRERIIPLLEELGEAWRRGDIAVRHEHLVSDVLEGRLRVIRQSVDASAEGRPMVLACLPEERHGLGLQMVALEVAAVGRRVLVLGLQTPIEEIIETAESANAVAVGLSVSLFAQTETTLRMITRLRAGLPPEIAMWIGGSGIASLTSLPERVQSITSMDGVAAAVRALPGCERI